MNHRRMFWCVRNTSLALALAVSLSACQGASVLPPPPADEGMSDPALDGGYMDPSQTILANLAHAPRHATLLAALDQSALADTLGGPGPFTLFAANDQAFDALGPQMQAMLEPRQKAALDRLMGYQIVPGRMDTAALLGQIKAGGGHAVLTTLSGATLVATRDPAGGVLLIDGHNRPIHITTANIYQANGVIMGTDGVLLPGGPEPRHRTRHHPAG